MSDLDYATKLQTHKIPAAANGSTPEMQDFCSRFEASIILRAGQETFSDGCRVSEYAEETAPAYYAKLKFRLIGPEKCAESDMRYWHGM